MASSEGSRPELERLDSVARQVANLQDEAARLNRRLRNARAAVRRLEEGLSELALIVERAGEADR